MNPNEEREESAQLADLKTLKIVVSSVPTMLPIPSIFARHDCISRWYIIGTLN